MQYSIAINAVKHDSNEAGCTDLDAATPFRTLTRTHRDQRRKCPESRADWTSASIGTDPVALHAPLIFMRFMLHFGALGSALTIPVHCRMKSL
jgi:hypothetical protein